MAEDIKFRHTMPVQIRFSDVDQFGHMNNSVYFSLYDCECRTVMVGYDLATKEPKLISEDYKEAICRYEEKTLEELSKERK